MTNKVELRALDSNGELYLVPRAREEEFITELKGWPPNEIYEFIHLQELYLRILESLLDLQRRGMIAVHNERGEPRSLAQEEENITGVKRLLQYLTGGEETI